MYICKKNHYEVTKSHNKVIMHDFILFLKFIYFVITIYITTWSGGQMVKPLGYGWGDVDSNNILDMVFHKMIMMTYHRSVKLKNNQNW